MKEGRKPEYPEKTPGDELQKKDVVFCVSYPPFFLLALDNKLCSVTPFHTYTFTITIQARHNGWKL